MNTSKASPCRASIGVLLLLAALPLAAAAPAFPAGEYSAGTVSMRFGADGSLQVRSGDKVLVDGTYSAQADQLRFTDKSGPMVCPKGQESGLYRWKMSGDSLVLTNVDDRCDGRLHDLTAQAWTKK